MCNRSLNYNLKPRLPGFRSIPAKGAVVNILDTLVLMSYTKNVKIQKKGDFPMDQKYESLFTPWKIGNVEIKNRIVMCPMGGTSLFGWFELTGCGFD